MIAPNTSAATQRTRVLLKPLAFQYRRVLTEVGSSLIPRTRCGDSDAPRGIAIAFTSSNVACDRTRPFHSATFVWESPTLHVDATPWIREIGFRIIRDRPTAAQGRVELDDGHQLGVHRDGQSQFRFE